MVAPSPLLKLEIELGLLRHYSRFGKAFGLLPFAEEAALQKLVVLPLLEAKGPEAHERGLRALAPSLQKIRNVALAAPFYASVQRLVQVVGPEKKAILGQVFLPLSPVLAEASATQPFAPLALAQARETLNKKHAGLTAHRQGFADLAAPQRAERYVLQALVAAERQEVIDEALTLWQDVSLRMVRHEPAIGVRNTMQCLFIPAVRDLCIQRIFGYAVNAAKTDKAGAVRALEAAESWCEAGTRRTQQAQDVRERVTHVQGHILA